MKTDLPDYVIVDAPLVSFFAERRGESEYTKGYYNVYELDLAHSDERNHYCIHEDFIYEIDWQ